MTGVPVAASAGLNATFNVVDHRGTCGGVVWP
jgi:hypothetical protein